MDRAAVDNLRNRIQRTRGGEVYFHVDDRDPAPAGDVRHVLDSFVVGYGYHALRDGWFEVSRMSAKRILVWILLHDLVYGTRTKDVDRERSALLADEFLSLFWANARYFTNASISVNEDGSYAPPAPYVTVESDSPFGTTHSRITSKLTKSTFDSGIAVVDSRRIGLVWFGDED